MRHADTIAAIATAVGPAGIGVVRVSGVAASQIASQIVRRSLAPRRATRAEFFDAQGGCLDQGIAVYLPGPSSYTGEDTLELQGHGGTAVLNLLLRRCLELGARLAAPGEFTERAFLNGKLDLAQAEAVADLVSAGSEAAARGALRSLTGDFSEKVHGISRRMIELRVGVEALIDFPEEELDVGHAQSLRASIEALRSELAQLLAQCRQGRLLRYGIRVVFLGQPNVGKSSLMNRLAQEEVSIVTDIPGTARDPLRHDLLLGGMPVRIVDTAGLRESVDAIEQLGMGRAWKEAVQADVALYVVDGTRGIDSKDRENLDKLPPGQKRLVVLNKSDLLVNSMGSELVSADTNVSVSALTGAGLEKLRELLLEMVGWTYEAGTPHLVRERHLQLLGKAVSSLGQAADQTQADLVAEELRQAQGALSEITGELTSEDLLGEILSSFCIGK